MRKYLTKMVRIIIEEQDNIIDLSDTTPDQISDDELLQNSIKKEERLT